MENWRTELSETVIDGMREFQQRVAEWNKHNFPSKVAVSDANQPFKGMVEELGELAHADLKMQQGIRGSQIQHERNAMDAVGDFLVYMADYCNMRGWDLASCMRMAWDEIKDRDWRRFPTNGKTE